MTIFKHISVYIVLVFITGGCANTTTIDKGAQCYNNRNYECAYRYWKAGVNQGLVGSKFNLAMLYINGQGVSQNFDEAYNLLTDVAKGSNTSHSTWISHQYLGLMNLYGKVPPASKEKAAYHFTLAAENESYNPQASQSQLFLGILYEHGIGVDQNYERALYYYKKSARTSPFGVTALGNMYANGLGVEKSLQTAMKYYKSSCNKGNKQACYLLNNYDAENSRNTFPAYWK